MTEWVRLRAAWKFFVVTLKWNLGWPAEQIRVDDIAPKVSDALLEIAARHGCRELVVRILEANHAAR